MACIADNRPGRLHRLATLPPWAYLATLFGLIGVLALGSYASRSLVYDGFVGPWLWRPIIHDEGYNPVNTTALVVVLVLLLLWVWRLLEVRGERFTLALVFAPLPPVLWGTILRVLEDADLFAPFAAGILASNPRVPPTSSCVPEVGGSFLHQCFGTLFVTPINFLWVIPVEVGAALLANEARRIANRFGLAAGVRFFGLTLVASFALYCAFWASEPSYVRLVPSPLIFLAGPILAYVVVLLDARRHAGLDWRWGLFAYMLVPLPLALYWLLVWLTKEGGDWRPTAATHPWILAAFLLIPALLAISMAWKGRFFSGHVKKPMKAKKERKPAISLGYLIFVEAIALFGTLLACHELFDKKMDWSAAGIQRNSSTLIQFVVGPLAVAIGIWVAARSAKYGAGTHRVMKVFTDPMNQLMLFAQAGDAFMTGLALDVYHAKEKHVVPSGLIDWAASLDLPPPLNLYPAADVMIPYKILLTLVFIWVLDVRIRPRFPGKGTLFALIKWAVVVVGLAPGTRDALRLAMGV